MTRINPQWLAALALTAAAFAASAYLYPSLPDVVPTHWNIKGQVDGHGPKAVAAWTMPVMMLAMLLVFRVLPALSPKNFELDTFQTTYLFVVLATTGLFAYMHGVILAATWQQVQGNPRFDIGRAMLGGVFLFFALIGNVMGKVRRNFYVGIKLPWTLANDRVWNDTHRLAAWTWVGGGLLGLVLVFSGLNVLWAFGVLTAATVVPCVYSFLHYKRLEREGAL